MEQATHAYPELRVSSTTLPSKLGGAIVNYLKESPKIVILAMGDKAVSNAIKGIIVSQSFLAASALDFNLKVGFKSNKSANDGKEITAIAFYLSRDW